MSLETLRTVLAELKAAEPGRRWDRALSVLVQCRIQSALSGARGWRVQSECEPSKEYWVCHLPCDVWTCTCPEGGCRGGAPFYRALKAAGWPTGFQVLCANCHRIKTLGR